MKTKFKIPSWQTHYQLINGTLMLRVGNQRCECTWQDDIYGRALVDQFGYAHQWTDGNGGLRHQDVDIDPVEIRFT